MSRAPFAQFPTQVHDLNIHRAVRDRIILAFDPADDLPPREDAPRMLGEQEQYLELAERQGNGFAGN